MHDGTIKRLRETLPPLLTVQQYCRLLSVCEAIAYRDLKTKPGIAVKIGGSTRFVTDAVLAEMLRLPEWVPQKDRAPKAKTVARKGPTRPKKRSAAQRREPDQEVRP